MNLHRLRVPGTSRASADLVEFGREVVGNLTTAMNSVPVFTALILGLYLAQEVQETEGDKGSGY
jgi:hypothetical protein